MTAKKKQNSRLVRLTIAVIALLLFCATGAAAIIGWLPTSYGIPAEILVLPDREQPVLYPLHPLP